jgi:hypothetical protein
MKTAGNIVGDTLLASGVALPFVQATLFQADILALKSQHGADGSKRWTSAWASI